MDKEPAKSQWPMIGNHEIHEIHGKGGARGPTWHFTKIWNNM